MDERIAWYEKHRAADLLQKLSQTKDLNSLKKNLVKDIPDWFSERELSLAFPISLVEGINKKDVETLQRAFGEPKEYRFSQWGNVFFDVNLVFAMTKKQDKAKVITRVTTQHANEFNTSCALLFFIPGAAYLAERFKIQEVPQRRTKDKNLSNGIKKADGLIKAVKKIREAVSAVDYPPADGWDTWVQRDAGQWIKNHNIENELKGLQDNIENKRDFLSNFRKALYRDLPHNTKANTSYTKNAQKSLSWLYQKSSGKKKDAVYSACFLLDKWDIKLTEDAVKKDSQRRKKGDKVLR